MKYNILALVAEQVSGQSMTDLIRQYIIAPLGLTDTNYNTRHPGGEIHGYGAELWFWADTWKYAENTGPDSGITATSSDVIRFLKALFIDHGVMRAIGDTFGYLSFALTNPEYGATIVGHINANEVDVLLMLMKQTIQALDQSCTEK